MSHSLNLDSQFLLENPYQKGQVQSCVKKAQSQDMLSRGWSLQLQLCFMQTVKAACKISWQGARLQDVYQMPASLTEASLGLLIRGIPAPQEEHELLVPSLPWETGCW